MKQLTLQQAFNLTFHNKFSFNDFLNLDISKHITQQNFKEILFFKTSEELKKYHNFLIYLLIKCMKINKEVVFSYREGVSIYDALYPHKNNQYFFKTDIKSFFGSISEENIKKCFLSNLNEFSIDKTEIKQYINQILNLIVYNNQLPVGFSTSSQLSNAILYIFDNELEEYCIKNDITYTRYSDDLIFSSKNKNNLLNLTTIIQDLLNLHFNNKLFLNKSKTKYFENWEKVEILGLIITKNGYITIDKKLKKNIEVILHFYLTDKKKFDDILNKRFNSKLSKISGLLNHINNIDKGFIIKLRKRYGNFVVDKFIHMDKNG
ncbi:MAG: reverse transcriptase domain-containing protein [Campylobacterota bacterium]|nr:reverse transcriptase domain-containing protein [Campylobacterota bacterium]